MSDTLNLPRAKANHDRRAFLEMYGTIRRMIMCNLHLQLSQHWQYTSLKTDVYLAHVYVVPLAMMFSKVSLSCPGTTRPLVVLSRCFKRWVLWNHDG